MIAVSTDCNTLQMHGRSSELILSGQSIFRRRTIDGKTGQIFRAYNATRLTCLVVEWLRCSP
jgi:hypothetical protein